MVVIPRNLSSAAMGEANGRSGLDGVCLGPTGRTKTDTIHCMVVIPRNLSFAAVGEANGRSGLDGVSALPIER
jgi:hypothetical protein